MITPINGNYLIEPTLRSDLATKDLRKRMSKSGLLVPDLKPDNRKSNFEGMPCIGTIRFVPADADPGLKVGMLIAFSEQNPRGFKHEGMTLFPLKQEQIIAALVGDK